MSTNTKHLQLIAAFSLLLIVSSSTEPYDVYESDTGVSFLHGYTHDKQREIAEADCSKCYRHLVIQLLNNSDNYFNLQMTFFPPNDTSPDFVIVRYNYSENGTSTIQNSTVWFWSSAVYFFFQPIRIFQFTSFMFSDPLLHQSTLTLHLPVNCVHVSDTFMKLLTQRLKLYAMHQKVNAPIDTNYQAKSHSVKTLIQWHTDNPNASRLVLSAQIVFPFLATIFMVLFFVYLIELEPRKFGQKLNNEIHSSTGYISASGKAKLLIILTISFLFNACALITDGFALKEYTTLAPEVKKYYDHKTIEFRCFYVIPFLMTVSDGLSLLFIIIPVAVAMKGYYGNEDTDKNNWSILVYTLLSPLSNIATHAYHIVIAFIDNPYHASSVLLFFTAVLFLHVVIFQKIYYYIFKWVKSQELSACCNPIKNNEFCWMLFLLGCYTVGIITLSVVIGLTVSMLILLPIDNAIDNAPTNIYTVFQASVAVIAAIVTFQVFFRETSSIGEVFIKARDKMVNVNNNHWKSMSEKEKELELAKQFLEYISPPVAAAPEQASEGAPAQGSPASTPNQNSLQSVPQNSGQSNQSSDPLQSPNVTTDPAIPQQGSGPLLSPSGTTDPAIPQQGSHPFQSPSGTTDPAIPQQGSGPLLSSSVPTDPAIPQQGSGPLLSSSVPTDPAIPQQGSGPLLSSSGTTDPAIPQRDSNEDIYYGVSADKSRLLPKESSAVEC